LGSFFYMSTATAENSIDIDYLLVTGLVIPPLQETPQEYLRRVLSYAQFHHAGQERDSGAPYIEHPIRVARIAQLRAKRISDEIGTTLQYPPEDIAMRLIHDVPEDAEMLANETETRKMRRLLFEIRDLFGYGVARGVEGLTQLKGDLEKRRPKEDTKLHYFFQTLYYLAKYPQTVEAKIDDKVHASETLQSIAGKRDESAEIRRNRIAEHILEYFVPLAFKVCMNEEGEIMMRNAARHITNESDKEAYLKALEIYKEKMAKIGEVEDQITPLLTALSDHLGYPVANDVLCIEYPNPHEIYLLYRLYGESTGKYVRPRVIISSQDIEDSSALLGLILRYNPLEQRIKNSFALALKPDTIPIENTIRIENLFLEDRAVELRIVARSEAWRYTSLSELILLNSPDLESFKAFYLSIYRESITFSNTQEQVRAFLFGDKMISVHFNSNHHQMEVNLPQDATPLDLLCRTLSKNEIASVITVTVSGAAGPIPFSDTRLTQPLAHGSHISVEYGSRSPYFANEGDMLKVKTFEARQFLMDRIKNAVSLAAMHSGDHSYLKKMATDMIYYAHERLFRMLPAHQGKTLRLDDMLNLYTDMLLDSQRGKGRRFNALITNLYQFASAPEFIELTDPVVVSFRESFGI
jgi:hypothetical protein